MSTALNEWMKTTMITWINAAPGQQPQRWENIDSFMSSKFDESSLYFFNSLTNHHLTQYYAISMLVLLFLAEQREIEGLDVSQSTIPPCFVERHTDCRTAKDLITKDKLYLRLDSNSDLDGLAETHEQHPLSKSHLPLFTYMKNNVFKSLILEDGWAIRARLEYFELWWMFQGPSNELLGPPSLPSGSSYTGKSSTKTIIQSGDNTTKNNDDDGSGSDGDSSSRASWQTAEEGVVPT